MKTYQHSSRRHQAFTLIELLVVIGIIALLASIAVPAGNLVLKKARAVQAKAAMKGVEIAIKGYQTEYNRYPASPGGADDGAPIVLGSGNALIQAIVIRGAQSSESQQANPRAISFYDAPPAKNGQGGMTPDGALNDPWGSPYTVAIDYNNDNELAIPEEAAAEGDPTTLATGVLIYSIGPSKGDTSKDPGAKDWIRSWR